MTVGVGISVVNALSDETVVEVARDRTLYRQRFARGLQQSGIVIDERPILLGVQSWRKRAQIGTAAAAEIDDPWNGKGREMGGKFFRQFAIACTVIGGFAQSEP